MEKITSEEAYLAYIKTLGTYDDWLLRGLNNFSWVYKKSADSYVVTWWAKREFARMSCEVYQVSEVLNRLNKQFPIFAHISLDDPKLVAFTPDAQCGENDKQVRLTIGKLISKYLPIISQKCLQEMILDHESETNPEILWASGQELTDIYKNMGSIGACMSKTSWAVHPTVAYHTDEIKLAYLKKGDTIVARTLVYEPKDGSKKVFIRMYPRAHALEKHLNKLGYVVGNFSGAKLNTVKIKYDQYALPYLDGNNTTASSEYSSTALIDGQITVLNSSLLETIRLTYPGKSHKKIVSYTANGYAEFENIDSKDFNQTCIVSGKKYTTLDLTIKTQRVFVNGEYGNALESEVPSNWINARELRSRITVMTDPSNVVFIDGEAFAISDTQTLISNGYKQLDQSLYPNTLNQWSCRFIKTSDDRNIKQSDAVYINHYDGNTVTSKTIHVSEFKSKNYLKLADGNYCTKDSKYLVTTSKKKVIPGLNTFYTLIDGTHTIRRPKCSDIFYEERYYSNSYSELLDFFSKNKEELYKKYTNNVLKTRSLESAARILLDHDYYTSINVARSKDISVTKILQAIVSTHQIDHVERKVANEYLAELTAVEY